MNKKNILLAVLVLAALLFSLFTISVASSGLFSVSAKAAVLYEPQTQSFLFEKNADMRLPMASTTKIMTAIVALENAELDKIVKVDERAAGIEGSSAYLSVDDEYTLEDMLYALMLRSANDAAVAIACAISGSVDGFVALMNQKAQELSLVNTHFDNPNGLDGQTHYTTARELAILSGYALRNDAFKEIVSTYKKTAISDSGERLFINHNKLLKRYDGAVGIKTGFTRKSGRCLVGAAERDGLTLISVTLDAPDDWNDHKAMLDLGFDTIECKTLAKKGEISLQIPLFGSELSEITVENESEIKAVIPKGKEVDMRIKSVRYAVAPIKKGEILGKVIYSIEGKEIASTDLLSKETVKPTTNKNIFSRIFS